MVKEKDKVSSYDQIFRDTKVITKEEGHDLAKKYNRQSEIGKPPSGKGKKIENGKARAGLGIRMIRNFTAMYEGRLECYLNGNNMFVTGIIFDKERYLKGQRKLVEM